MKRKTLVTLLSLALICGLALGVGLQRERAYRAALPLLTTVTVGEGQLDLARNVPRENRVLLASVATLVVNDRFHPGLAPLVLEAASDLEQDGGLLERPGEFPAARPVDFPLLAEAEHYHRYGQPLLMRFLPFWVGTIAVRVVILALPMVALLIPLLKVAPPLYRWRTRRRIFRWYRHLREVTQRLRSGEIRRSINEEIQRLHEIEDEILAVQVPLSYADELYDLHLHVEWVIRRVERMRDMDEGTPTPSTPQPAPG